MPAKKAKTKKKAAPKKKVAAKKAAPKKKVAAKKAAPKKKVAAKKAAPKKKAAVKKAAPKKKAAVKKAAPKKKAAVKKAAPKKKAAVKKAAPKKKAATPVEKKPSKYEIKQLQAQAEREKKKQKRIELLNKRSPVELPVEGITPYTLHRGESYMSDAQLEHFRSILLHWKQELIDEVKRTVDQMKSNASRQFADPADRATQEEEFSLELRTRARESKLIRKINQTLSTIDSEDYGYCESCGIEIGIKRLEARPTATLCVDCKTLQEIKEKQIFT